MGYVFRPSKALADKVAALVRELQCEQPNLNVSTFLDFAIERTVEDCSSREELLSELKAYISSKQKPTN